MRNVRLGSTPDGVREKTLSTEVTKGAWPWAAVDPAAWTPDWWARFLPAPQRLTQPILPGWTVAPVVTINGVNSSAPQTETEVVQRHSYGRQLGRMADALQALIEERGQSAPGDERLMAFAEMKEEIDDVKLDVAAARVDRLCADLAGLKAARPAEYRRLRDELRTVLDE
jgi:hypothetical protein